MYVITMLVPLYHIKILFIATEVPFVRTIQSFPLKHMILVSY